jgi:hypothetical protein
MAEIDEIPFSLQGEDPERDGLFARIFLPYDISPVSIGNWAITFQDVRVDFLRSSRDSVPNNRPRQVCSPHINDYINHIINNLGEKICTNSYS